MRIFPSLKSLFLEILPAYIHLCLTRRWITISVLGIDETMDGWENITLDVIVRAPSLRERYKSLRLGKSDQPERIPVIALTCAMNEIRTRKFPRTTVIINTPSRRFVLIFPKRDSDLDF